VRSRYAPTLRNFRGSYSRPEEIAPVGIRGLTAVPAPAGRGEVLLFAALSKIRRLDPSANFQESIELDMRRFLAGMLGMRVPFVPAANEGSSVFRCKRRVGPDRVAGAGPPLPAGKRITVGLRPLRGLVPPYNFPHFAPKNGRAQIASGVGTWHTEPPYPAIGARAFAIPYPANG
jgi:hypothetical protein